MKVLKLDESRKKKQTGALLGVEPFNTGDKPKKPKKPDVFHPDYEKSMKILNHNLGNDTDTNIGKPATPGASSGDSSGDSSGAAGGCSEAINKRGNLMTRKQIRESLLNLDREALDNDSKYYDLATLYEALETKLTDADRKEITNMLRDKSKGYEELNTYLSGVASRDNKQEISSNIKATVEDYQQTEFEELSDIYQDEKALNEGRHDLVPKKCVSIETHHTYWSPYDTKEKDYAKFGIRFRYEDRESCLDAINDTEKDLGYADKKSSKQKAPEEPKGGADEIKDESLMKSTLNEFKSSFEVPEDKAEEEDSREQKPEDNKDLDKGEVVDREAIIKSFSGKAPSQIAQEYQMTAYNHKITTRDGSKIYKDIDILIAIYNLTNGGDPTIPTTKEEANILSGTDTTIEREKVYKRTINAPYWSELEKDKPPLIQSGYYDNNGTFHVATPDMGAAGRNVKIYATPALKSFIEDSQVVCMDHDGFKPLIDRSTGKPVTINIKTDIIDNPNIKKNELNSRNQQEQGMVQRSHPEEISVGKASGGAVSSNGKVNVRRYFKQNGIQEVDDGWLIIPPKVFGFKGGLATSATDSESDDAKESLQECSMNEDLRRHLQEIYKNVLSIPIDTEVGPDNFDDTRVGFVCARCGYSPELFRQAFDIK